ncbi:MAG: DUF2971 domain-containing protein [Bdellovibrionia bacterium]
MIENELFKYRAWDKFAKDILESGRLWISSIEKLNDPFEATMMSSNEDDTDRIEELEKYMKIRDKFGIISLSKTANQLLLWSHYGDAHKGVCIGFSGLSKNTSYSEIKYITRQPLSHKQPFEILKFKSSHWRYEQEGRLIFNNKKNKHINLTELNSIISSVTLGLNIDHTHAIKIHSICSEKNIPVYYCMKDKMYRIRRLKMDHDGLKRFHKIGALKSIVEKYS